MTAWRVLVHLRLAFQLLLSPVWLWGWLISGGGWSASGAIGFVAFHGFLYSGVTAFNSYYDRDVGPVGGLEHPPRVPESLLWISLLVQAIGLLICFAVNTTVAAVYCAFVVLSVAYSHPRIRVKAHTYASLILVAVGQGVLAFIAAWAAVRGSADGVWSRDGVLGAFSAALLILALYPLTQLYQVEEDALRGDRTLAVAWGPRACCVFTIACTAIGGGMMTLLLWLRFGAIDGALVGLGLLAQIGLVLWLATTFSRDDTRSRYRRVMRLARVSAIGLGGYLLVRLAMS